MNRIINKFCVTLIMFIVFCLFPSCGNNTNGHGSPKKTDSIIESSIGAPITTEDGSEASEMPAFETESVSSSMLPSERPTEKPRNTPVPTERVVHGPPEGPFDFDAYERNIVRIRKMPPSTSGPLVIPVYYEDFLLYDSFFAPMALGSDGALCEYAINCTMQAISTWFPEFAVRKTGTGEFDYYVMYDTDTGYRLYNHMFGMRLRAGIGVLLKKDVDLLCYDDFKSLKIGDSIDDVCAVDPITECYKRAFQWCWDDFNYFNGYELSSMHYLSDGILCVEYELIEPGVVRIKNIVYSEDYILPDHHGVDINYKIVDLDLP